MRLATRSAPAVRLGMGQTDVDIGVCPKGRYNSTLPDPFRPQAFCLHGGRMHEAVSPALVAQDPPEGPHRREALCLRDRKLQESLQRCKSLPSFNMAFCSKLRFWSLRVTLDIKSHTRTSGLMFAPCHPAIRGTSPYPPLKAPLTCLANVVSHARSHWNSTNCDSTAKKADSSATPCPDHQFPHQLLSQRLDVMKTLLIGVLWT